MPKITLTNEFIRTAPAGKHFDAKLPGFYVYKSAKGEATFSYKFYDGKAKAQRTLPVNHPTTKSNVFVEPAFDVKAARKACDVLKGGIAKGTVTTETVRHEIAADAVTFEDAVTALLAPLWKEVDSGKRSAANVRGKVAVFKRPLAAFGKRPLNTITADDVQPLLDGIIAEGKVALSNKVRTFIHTVFKFASGPGRRWVNYNATTGLDKRAEEKVGDRVLSRAALNRFWHGLDRPDIKCDRRIALTFKLIIATMLRPSEVLLARRSEIKVLTDQEGGDGKLCYRNPGKEWGRRKKGRAITQPINSLAAEVIAELLKLPTKDDLLIPPGRQGGWLTVSHLDRALHGYNGEPGLCELLGFTEEEGREFAPFKPHDLRRTPSSQLRLGWKERGFARVPVIDTDRCLDHAPADENGRKLTKTSLTYDISERVLQTELRRDTLDKLDALLRAILDLPAAGNVVKLRAKAA